MKLLKQFFIITVISLAGELLNAIIPLPIPSGIYGMVILFLCLVFKVIKLESVKDASKLLLDIMPILFIPAGVGLIASWDNLLGMLLPAIVIMVVTLVTVMAVTGISSQTVLRIKSRRQGGKE